MRRRIKAFLGSKYGKLGPVLVIAVLVVTASSTVYTFYYGNATATVRIPDVQLVAGADLGGSCTAYPCASGTISSTHDTATMALSFFPATTGTPTPATYYSNLLIVKNTAVSGSHSISSIQILNIGGTTADLGSITVYYCATQTEFSANGSPVTPCVGSYSITSTIGGSLSGIFPQTLTSGSQGYIEVVAYAASGAAASSSVTFQIAIQWV